jgi:hypothetical protein
MTPVNSRQCTVVEWVSMTFVLKGKRIIFSFVPDLCGR